MPFSVREGINIFLAGYIPTENMRFRDTALNFKVYKILIIILKLIKFLSLPKNKKVHKNKLICNNLIIQI